MPQQHGQQDQTNQTLPVILGYAELLTGAHQGVFPHLDTPSSDHQEEVTPAGVAASQVEEDSQEEVIPAEAAASQVEEGQEDLPQTRGHQGDRLVGNTPFIYNGDPKRAEEFMAAWKLYQRVNRGTSQMDNMYKRAMIFLTYIQGPATMEWVHSISDWLEQAVQVSHEYDRRLWDYTEEAFQRKFGDTLSEERAIAELRGRIKMEGGDLDGFINRFEILVRHANYDPDHSMVLQKFTDGLPMEMYKSIFGKDNAPTTYQEWRDATIQQQRKWVHYRGRLDLFKTNKPKPFQKQTFPKPAWGNAPNTFRPPRDPYVMDTSPGRVQARVAEVDDYFRGGNRWSQSVNNPANRPNKPQNRGPREVICYNCML